MYVKKDGIYGIYYFKLDRIGKHDKYMLAYGDKRNVQLFREQFKLVGDYREYKHKGWLVRRIEKLKSTHKDKITIRCVDDDYSKS